MFEVKKLGFDYIIFDGIISKETFEFHHDKHYSAYVNKLNDLIKGNEFENLSLTDIVKKSYNKNNPVFNNAGQVYNHEFYFDGLKKDSKMSDKFLKRINENFGSYEKFAEEFINTGVGTFGSGWVWLCEDKDGKLKIVSTSNAVPCWILGDYKPLMVVDVWEHAYYIDYRNDRKNHITNILSIIDWDKLG